MRPRFAVWVALITIVTVVTVRLVAGHLARDRYYHLPIKGTRYQIRHARFWIVNETGHPIRLRASAGGRELFQQDVVAEKPTPAPGWTSANKWDLEFPIARVSVSAYDQLNEELELQEELFLGKKQSVRVKGYPDRPDDFWIRVTVNGFKVEYGSVPND